MEVSKLLKELHDLGLSITFEDKNIYVSPSSLITDYVRLIISENKSELLDELKNQKNKKIELHKLIEQLNEQYGGSSQDWYDLVEIAGMEKASQCFYNLLD